MFIFLSISIKRDPNDCKEILGLSTQVWHLGAGSGKVEVEVQVALTSGVKDSEYFFCEASPFKC